MVILVVHHVQSTAQEKWCSKRPGYQQRSVEKHYCEGTTFIGMSAGQYSPTARVVHLAANADRMHL